MPANSNEPVHFQIDWQEPQDILKVNPNTGALSLLRRSNELSRNVDGNNKRNKVQVGYSVTNADGVSQGGFIIIDLEEEE